MATVSIVAIGDELLLGDQLDTNSQWLSQACKRMGLQVVAHIAASDAAAPLAQSLRWAAQQADVVVCCGGLGPTSDDRTRAVIADVIGRPLVRDVQAAATIAERFAAMKRDMPPDNLQQADVPEGATVAQPRGTAAGFAVTDDAGTLWVALPGVPWELTAMFDEDIAPLLAERFGPSVTDTQTVLLSGIGESDAARQLATIEAAAEAAGVTVSYLAKAGVLRVRFTTTADTTDAARALSGPFVENATALFGEHVIGTGDSELHEAVVQLLAGKGRTVALAESVTAGRVAALLARVPGASDVLTGGAVVYTAATKQALADVPAAMLDEHGSVAAATSRALADGIRLRCGADIGVGVTGEAGPAASSEHPVGTIFVAVTDDQHQTEATFRFAGDRRYLQRRFTQFALEILRQHLRKTDL